jgi:hypothetical protein
MERLKVELALLSTLVVIGIITLGLPMSANAAVQSPVTGTPEGARVVVLEQVNVRTGPSTNYDQIGVLIAGQTAPAIGRSPGGEWIQIVYAGAPSGVAWVFSPLVVLENVTGLLPIVEPPPTPTPRTTATIDPTFAAQFQLGAGPPTRLPTFTAAPPPVLPTLQGADTTNGNTFPPIIVIFSLFIVGISGLILSFLRSR